MRGRPPVFTSAVPEGAVSDTDMPEIRARTRNRPPPGWCGGSGRSRDGLGEWMKLLGPSGWVSPVIGHTDRQL